MTFGSHISLFAGVDMTGLAASALGYKTVATAEIDPWNRDLLKARHGGAWHADDVRKIDKLHPGVNSIKRPLLVTGGFPCQDVSAIGTGQGLAGARSGLWSEFARVIHVYQPDCVLIENSPMLRNRGLDRVLCDLADMGYDARWDCIPAAAVGAPHLRDRIFIVAWKGTSLHHPTKSQAENALGYAISAGVVSRAWMDLPDAPSPREYITRFPRSGSMQDSFVYEETPRAPIKDAKQACLAHAVSCPATPTGAWPTPAASIPQDGENPDTWLARRESLKAKGINGNGAGMPLSIAVKLFPTPRAAANEWRTTRNAPSHGKGHGKTLAGEVNDLERAAGRTPAPSSESAGNVNPEWVEWLMGLPLGYTDPAVPSNALRPHPGWAVEPAGVPRTLADAPHRKARLKALGNGLVYQAALRALIDFYPHDHPQS